MFRRVTLPLSLPGVLSGITMVFVPAVSTFAISQLLGGGKQLLLGNLIEMQFKGAAYNPQPGLRRRSGDDAGGSGLYDCDESLW